MQRLQRGFFRILKGPTGGLMASLALAAFLGGVAIAAPGAGPTAAGRHISADAAAPGVVVSDGLVANPTASDVRPSTIPSAFAGHRREGGSSRGPTGGGPGSAGGGATSPANHAGSHETGGSVLARGSGNGAAPDDPTDAGADPGSPNPATSGDRSGSTGSTGPAGSTGSTGPTGATGTGGVNGASGSTGSTGSTGGGTTGGGTPGGGSPTPHHPGDEASQGRV